jgi:hypothetical protein
MPSQHAAMARCASRGQRSGCEGAQRAGSAQETVPRALPGSAAVIGCFSHQPDALTCHPRRAQPARPAAESVPNAATTRRWPAVMTPRDGGLRACDLVASHRAADGPGPSIEGARTHARCISRGAVAAVTCVWHAIRPILGQKRAKLWMIWIYLDLRPRPSAYQHQLSSAFSHPSPRMMEANFRGADFRSVDLGTFDKARGSKDTKGRGSVP